MPGSSAAASVARTARRWDFNQGFPPACLVHRGEDMSEDPKRLDKSDAGVQPLAPMSVWRLLGEAGIERARIRTQHCTRPVRLQGSTRLVSTTTGEVRPVYSSSDEIDGITSVPCGNRRAAVCDACSATYKRDAWGLIRLD